MTNATIPADQLAVLKDLSTAGDTTAGDLLSRFGGGSDPEQKPEPTKEEGNAQGGDGAAAGDAPNAGAPDPSADATVDPERPRNEDPNRRPSRMDTIRDLRRDRRQLKADNEALRKQSDEFARQLTALNDKIKALENSGPRGGEAKEDDVVALLSRPGEYLSEREKRLVESVQKAVDEKLQRALASIPGQLAERSGKAQAREILNGIKDFNLDDDEDELMELVQAKTGLDANDVEMLLTKRPAETAAKLRRIWEEAKKISLSPQAAAAKAAAASAVPSGSSAPKPKRTLEQLNQDFANARTPQDRDRILKEIQAITG